MCVRACICAHMPVCLCLGVWNSGFAWVSASAFVYACATKKILYSIHYSVKVNTPYGTTVCFNLRVSLLHIFGQLHIIIITKNHFRITPKNEIKGLRRLFQ